MLTTDQQELCLNTVASTSLYYLALDALENRQPFSIVRMADGEKSLYDLILQNRNNGPALKLLPGIPGAPVWLTENWLRKMGLYAIPLQELRIRMNEAAMNSTWFAPSPTGLVDPEYNVYGTWPPRARYAEHFFNIIWNDLFKETLFRKAGHVLCIHGNAHTADSMQIRVQANLGVKISYLPLNAWTQTKDVIAKARNSTAPLVIFSGGPASKMIGPLVAQDGRVVLDIGNQMDRWTFSHLPIDRDKASAFHKEWSARNTQWLEAELQR
jgi:hypothetical protein